jgi:hypothetical protein
VCPARHGFDARSQRDKVAGLSFSQIPLNLEAGDLTQEESVFSRHIESHGRETLVIHITQEQAEQVKYLLEQAMQGNHILFDPATLRKILEKPVAVRATPSASEDEYSVEHHIEKIMSFKGLPEKRAYLERLDDVTFEGVVRTYLTIVENTLFEAKGTIH